MMKKSLWALAMLFICNFVAAQQRDTLTLNLERALQIAMSENPTIKVAEKEISLKKVANKETWQNLLPQVGINAALDHTIQAAEMKLNGMTFKLGQDGTNTVNGALSVSMPIFAPTVYRAMQMTKTDIQLAVEKSRESKQELINQVTKAYYQLLLAQDSYEVMKKSYQLSQENLEVVSAKFSQGKVSEFDKITAEVQLRSVKPTVVSAENAVRLSKIQLKVLMGVTENLEISIEDNLSNYESLLFGAELNQDTINLANNTTMKQLNLNLLMLEKNIKTQRMNFVPTLGVSWNYQYQSLYNDNLRFSQYNWAGSSSVALSLSIPLYRASNFTKVRTAKIQMEQLRWNRIDAERKLNMQVESYRNNMIASSEQVLSNKENVLQAEKAATIAGKMYEVGKGTILELNGSQVSLTQAELVYNQSIYDYLVAKADLDKVLGKDK